MTDRALQIGVAIAHGLANTNTGGKIAPLVRLAPKLILAPNIGASLGREITGLAVDAQAFFRARSTIFIALAQAIAAPRVHANVRRWIANLAGSAAAVILASVTGLACFANGVPANIRDNTLPDIRTANLIQRAAAIGLASGAILLRVRLAHAVATDIRLVAQAVARSGAGVADLIQRAAAVSSAGNTVLFGIILAHVVAANTAPLALPFLLVADQAIRASAIGLASGAVFIDLANAVEVAMGLHARLAVRVADLPVGTGAISNAGQTILARFASAVATNRAGGTIRLFSAVMAAVGQVAGILRRLARVVGPLAVAPRASATVEEADGGDNRRRRQGEGQNFGRTAHELTPGLLTLFLFLCHDPRSFFV